MLEFASAGADDLVCKPEPPARYWRDLSRRLEARQSTPKPVEPSAIVDLSDDDRRHGRSNQHVKGPRFLSLGGRDKIDRRLMSPSDMAAAGYFDSHESLNVVAEILRSSQSEIELVPEPARLPCEYKAGRVELDIVTGNINRRRPGWVLVWAPIDRFTPRRFVMSGLSVTYGGTGWTMPPVCHDQGWIVNAARGPLDPIAYFPTLTHEFLVYLRMQLRSLESALEMPWDQCLATRQRKLRNGQIKRGQKMTQDDINRIFGSNAS